MATINLTITVPNNKQAEILDYVVRNLGWTDLVQNSQGQWISNPETQLQAFKRFLLRFIKENYKAYKTTVDTKTAQANASTYVDGVDISAS